MAFQTQPFPVTLTFSIISVSVDFLITRKLTQSVARPLHRSYSTHLYHDYICSVDDKRIHEAKANLIGLPVVQTHRDECH